MPMPNQRFHIYAQSDSQNNEAVFVSLYCIVLHCTALYCIVMYCTALYCRPWWDVMEDYMLYFFVVMSTLDIHLNILTIDVC